MKHRPSYYIKAIAATAALGLGTIISGAEAAPLNSWVGTWENSSSTGLQQVRVTKRGSQLFLSAEGKCTPTNCKWGTVPAIAFSPSGGTTAASDTDIIMAAFSPGFATKTVILSGLSRGSISVRTLTDFTDASGRNDYTKVVRLRKKRRVARTDPPVLATRPDLPFQEDCISFNPANVSVGKRNNRWKLLQGSMWMLDAGNKKSEMDRAKQIVQHYSMNKQCFVGRGNPSLSYWLRGGNAPTGALPGEDCVGINPARLGIKPVNGKFTITSNGTHYAFFTPTRAEATKVIQTIRHYGFTKSCFVGRPGASMKYLRK